ncbi:glycosyltransferase [Mycolicibacterium goodii]|uniref:Glycosyl transferase n=1 Tax=Mycolicibacterium goodii TaxID=134601 RepID=A0A0K0XGA7_MYCGD|nr:glycosyl transferase [Mycolicibacterium goodii]
MADILIASHSPTGRVGPLLNIAYGLVGRGDRVTVLTCAEHTDAIRASGATPVTLPEEAAALTQLFGQHRHDAIIADDEFLAIFPFLLGQCAERPPVLAFSTRPLAAFFHDDAPPSDFVIAPTVPQFDYPRSDLPRNVRYVGAVHPMLSRGYRRPMWWRLLDGERPVVHVTQGTVDNTDLRSLLEPAIEALAEQDVVVIASTGGRDLDVLRTPVPANTYVAKYIPHDLLMPKVDVLVTNGGYGTVQRALSCGVPMVVAAKTGDKPELAARVAWSGAGIDLRTGTPSPDQIRRAVREVLTDKRYLGRARALEAAFAQRDGVAEIMALVDEVIAARRQGPVREQT